jgi:glutathionylspermidine synthase
MRSLIADSSAADPAAYRAFIRAAQLEGLMADYLVEGEPYLAHNAVVLDPADDALLGTLTEAFTSALVRAGRIIARDVPLLVEMGFPWVAAELLAAEPAVAPIVGRFDFVQDTAGHWWLLEYNADTPSGIRETVVVDELAHASLGEAHGLRRPSAAFGAALRDAFVDACADLPAGSTLGLVTNAGEMEDLAQLAFIGRLAARKLERRGLGVVLADLDNVSSPRGRLALCGQPVAALYRGAPIEAMLGTPAFPAIFEPVATNRLRLLNGLFGLLLQHKGLLAWAWMHRADPMFSDRERWAIESHLPPTHAIDDVPSAERAAFVAKQVFGREGEEVFFGDETASSAWEVLQRRRTYVAQQRVDVQGLTTVVPTALGPVAAPGFATVGCFNVRHRAVGYYTRFGGRVTTSHAKWLATFITGDGPISGTDGAAR